MMSPLSTAPVDTPAVVVTVSVALALVILPILFASVCLLRRFTGVSRPPYFAYFCAFGSLGPLSLGIASANSPLSVLGFFIAFLVSPFFLVRNFFALRSQACASIYHRAARWASLFSLAVLVLLLVWTVFDQFTGAPNKRARGDGGMTVLLHAGRAWPAAPQHWR